MLNKYSWRVTIVLLLVLTLLTLVLVPLLGSLAIPLPSLFQSSLEQDIFLNLRLPRVLFAFLVGFSLTLVGAVFQALLRNDLATPYTLGVSSGGALGAVLALKSGLEVSYLGLSSTVLFSMLGSLGTVFIIYLIARGQRGMSAVTLVLTGVTFSLLFSSLILFIHYLADFTETYRMVHWLMGGLQTTGWIYNGILVIPVSLAFIYFINQSRALNILTAGREMALSKGVDLYRLQKRSFFGTALLVGMVVALAGPIGFVGLIIPHLVRLLVGPDHRRLLIAAPLVGGIFLVWCDTLARTIIAPAELPVGIVTAMVGGPFFIWLLIRHKKRSG
jgi:iron complex transport system permease protein